MIFLLTFNDYCGVVETFQIYICEIHFLVESLQVAAIIFTNLKRCGLPFFMKFISAGSYSSVK